MPFGKCLMLNDQIINVIALLYLIQKAVIIIRKSYRRKIAAFDRHQTGAGCGNDIAFFSLRQDLQLGGTVFKFIINAVDFQRCNQVSGIGKFNKCSAILSDRNQFFAFIIKLNCSAGGPRDGFQLVIAVNKSPSFFIPFAIEYPVVALCIITLGGIGLPF